jgi:uridine kinase
MDNKKQPLFVIICGGSGSGKTTFTNLVLKNINNKFTSQLISLDNFYIPVPDEKLPGYNFDSPNALN